MFILFRSIFSYSDITDVRLVLYILYSLCDNSSYSDDMNAHDAVDKNIKIVFDKKF